MAKPTLPRDKFGHGIQVLGPEPSTAVTGATGAASARSTLPANAEIVMVTNHQDCYIRFGDSSVAAAATDFYIPKGERTFKVPAGATHCAYIQHTTGGAISFASAE